MEKKITEYTFKNFFSRFGNTSEKYENEKKIIVYTLKKIDNKFNISYHLEFHQKNIQLNFWFDKINNSVTVSFFNGNEFIERNKLKNILTTNYLNELKIVCDKFLQK